MFWVYVLQNPAGKIYIGQTADLERRIAQHNDPENKLTRTTKRFPGPWILVFSESGPTRTDALKRERYLKTGHGRKWLSTQIGC